MISCTDLFECLPSPLDVHFQTWFCVNCGHSIYQFFVRLRRFICLLLLNFTFLLLFFFNIFLVLERGRYYTRRISVSFELALYFIGNFIRFLIFLNRRLTFQLYFFIFYLLLAYNIHQRKYSNNKENYP